MLVFLLLNFKCSLCILDNSPLSDMPFANIFSQSVICLLIFSTVSFTEQKFFILMKSSLSIIFFYSLCLRASPYSRSSRFHLMLSSRSFIVLHFTFMSMIHFELIFVKGLRFAFRFLFLHLYVQLFQHHLFKRLPLLHCIAFGLMLKVSWLYLCVFIYVLSILFHQSVSFLAYNTLSWLLAGS